MFFKFRERKSKLVHNVEYSKIKDLPKYEDRVKALLNIFVNK